MAASIVIFCNIKDCDETSIATIILNDKLDRVFNWDSTFDHSQVSIFGHALLDPRLFSYFAETI